MISLAPTLPYSQFKYGLNHIPAPSPSSFDAEFGGLLPSGTSIPSSYGKTRYYAFHPISSPTGRNLILIHGGGTPALGMAPLALKLAEKGENVIAYDLWGHGCSSTPLAPHTHALFHHQLLELLSHLQWTSAHILGFSFGGCVAATFAATHPKAVESLVLVSPAGLLRKSDRGWFDAFIEDGGWGREWFARRKIVDGVEGLNAKPAENWKENLKKGVVDTVAVETWQRENHGGHAASVVGMFRDGVFDQHESYRTLARSETKAMVMIGSEDGVFEEKMVKRELESVGWKGGMRVVKGAGHAIMRSHVADVVGVVEEFWGGKN